MEDCIKAPTHAAAVVPAMLPRHNRVLQHESRMNRTRRKCLRQGRGLSEATITPRSLGGPPRAPSVYRPWCKKTIQAKARIISVELSGSVQKASGVCEAPMALGKASHHWKTLQEIPLQMRPKSCYPADYFTVGVFVTQKSELACTRQAVLHVMDVKIMRKKSNMHRFRQQDLFRCRRAASIPSLTRLRAPQK